MANTRITDLTAYTDPATTDVLPIVDVGADTTKKVSVGEIVSKITGDIDVDATGTAAISAGAIVNADVNASAAIAGTKISPNFGAQTIQTTGVFSIPLGSAGAPSVAVTGDPNTGIYSTGADQLAISTGGTGRLFVDASGNVGLNLSSSLGLTGYSGMLRIRPASSGAAGFFADNGAGDSWFGVYGGTSAADSAAIVYPSTGYLRIATSTSVGVGGFSEKMRITSAGNVGVGTASPSQPLHIVGTTASALFEGSIQGGITIQKAGTLGINLVSDQAGTLIFYNLNGNNERARIDSSGRLLVGTSSARANFYNTSISSRLQVEGANDGNSRAISCVYGQSNASGPILILGKHRSDSLGGTTVVSNDDEIGALTFQGSDGTEFVAGAQITAYVDGTPGANDMPGRLVFSTTADGSASPTERLRITSDAYVRLASGTGGIQFNGDTTAANALDDYEEGTWTPVIAGSTTAGTATYSTQVGYYTKVGRLVTVQAYLNWSGGTGAGGLLISSLPFALPAGNFYFPVAFGLVAEIALLANNYITGYANANSTYIIITQSPVGGGSYNNVSYDAAGHLMLSCFYYV